MVYIVAPVRKNVFSSCLRNKVSENPRHWARMERGVISTHYRGQEEQTSCKRISASRAIPSLYPQLSPPLAPFLPSFFSFPGSSHPALPSSHGEIKWWNASGRGWKGRECLLSRIFLLSFLFPFPRPLSLVSPFFSRWNTREGASLFLPDTQN